MRIKGALRLSTATGLALALGLGVETPAVAQTASAQTSSNEIPPMPLHSALEQLARNSGIDIVYASNVAEGIQSRGAPAGLAPEQTLNRLLHGTGLTYQRNDGAYMIFAAATPRSTAPTAPTGASIETVTVTAEKMNEDIQTVPIAVTAMTQKELTTKQIAGGPDLIKEVPNLTFSKTNFSGYNIEIRGIGTQAISATTDPAVAVAFNGIPFIRNHFFEQEFYDLSSAEVLRGPQGTLYGRNATAGVVNIISAKPSDEYEAMASVDFGNHGNRRFEGMVNIPIVDDRLDIRVAGEWTKRDGYSTDTTTNSSVDGRDLWSGRVTVGWKPSSDIQTYLVWEHFSEDDNRLRSSKQLCMTDPGPSSIGGVPLTSPANIGSSVFQLTTATFSQACLPNTSLYAKTAFEVPNGYALPFVSGGEFEGFLDPKIDPYTSTTQSTNLRDIQSEIRPSYKAKNDTVEFNADWHINPELTFSSQTGYNNDSLFATEDYNRFDTSPGIFQPSREASDPGVMTPAGVFCDPQLGCSSRLLVQDLSQEHAWQLGQEFRLASSFEGPFNFSVGGNYLHYETEENYYVFSNSFTIIAINNIGYNCTPKSYAQNCIVNVNWNPGVTDESGCLEGGYQYSNPSQGGGVPTEECVYIDPNPISKLNGEGHNYFVSENPYVLNSYAMFGEAYYDVTKDLKLTAGARWTVDEKHFVDIPSWLVANGWGYPSTGAVDQSWDRWTGRAVASWSPQLDITDQSMFYASYSHGYKAGGANPPGPVFSQYTYSFATPVHTLTFKPEYIEAFELGTKNTALDGALTLNGDVFYYNYTGYQISQIVDRTAINSNFNAHVQGAELESTYEPIPGLRFSFAGGYEDTHLAGGTEAVDLMNRTNSNPNWVLMRPFVTQASNCILPVYVAAEIITVSPMGEEGNPYVSSCSAAYFAHLDPVTLSPYVPNPAGYPGYPGFDPSTAPNGGQGFSQNLSHKQLPNAPHYTVSLSGEYTRPVTQNWAATLHADFYWQSNSWARVQEDPIDRIHGYSTVNLSLILNSASGWQGIFYVKNVFDVTAITGTFLNSDDSGLTTNVFLTDPRLFGIRITKHFGEGDDSSYGVNWLNDLVADKDGGRPPLWIELGGAFEQLAANREEFTPPFTPQVIAAGFPSPITPEKAPTLGLEWKTKATLIPEESDWVLSVGVRYGRSNANRHLHQQTAVNSVPSLYGSFSLRDHKNEDVRTANAESHAILDFDAGKDVGLGMFGIPGSSVVSAGVRYADFEDSESGEIQALPTYTLSNGTYRDRPRSRQIYDATIARKSSFQGFGPSISWDANTPLSGNPADGSLTLDWGVNAAILFGRQKASNQHQSSGQYYCLRRVGYYGSCPKGIPTSGTYHYIAKTQHGPTTNIRSRTYAVPNLGGFAGFSIRYPNAKVSFGYRADVFFSAIDGGVDTRKLNDRGFFGPYANITIGIGG